MLQLQHCYCTYNLPLSSARTLTSYVHPLNSNFYLSTLTFWRFDFFHPDQGYIDENVEDDTGGGKTERQRDKIKERERERERESSKCLVCVVMNTQITKICSFDAQHFLHILPLSFFLSFFLDFHHFLSFFHSFIHSFILSFFLIFFLSLFLSCSFFLSFYLSFFLSFFLSSPLYNSFFFLKFKDLKAYSNFPIHSSKTETIKGIGQSFA